MQARAGIGCHGIEWPRLHSGSGEGLMDAMTSQSPSKAANGAGESLDSWKAIAGYLKRDLRTVRRWEQEGLPVHRHMHKSRASVYAFKSEIDAWWQRDRVRLEAREVAAKTGHRRV